MSKKQVSQKTAAPKKTTTTPQKSATHEHLDPLDVSVAATTPPTAPTTAPEPAPAPAPPKAPKKKQSEKKSDKAPEPVPLLTKLDVVAQPVETTNTVEQTTELDLLSNVMTDFSTNLQNLTSQLNNLRTEFKSLSKVVSRELKQASKASRRKRSGGNKQPSGFVKPTLITDELATFLGRDAGSEMARTEVTKEINQYIRDNKLQDSNNGRHINPDAKLTKLLGYDGSETLTYFNLQKYLSPHFVKPAQQQSA